MEYIKLILKNFTNIGDADGVDENTFENALISLKKQFIIKLTKIFKLMNDHKRNNSRDLLFKGSIDLYLKDTLKKSYNRTLYNLPDRTQYGNLYRIFYPDVGGGIMNGGNHSKSNNYGFAKHY